MQTEEGLDYGDPTAVQAVIPRTWWLTSLECKFMLCCFVHKDCKDISTQPTTLPAGNTRKDVRANSREVLGKERERAKEDRIVGGERYGDVEHQLKKARVVGMEAQAAKLNVETIQAKLMLLKEHADLYKATHGEEVYNKMVVDLLNKMTGLSGVGNMETPVSAANTQTDDDDGYAVEEED
jgi:hypothetical protein